MDAERNGNGLEKIFKPDTDLVQTRVSHDVKRRLEKLANEEGLSLAAYVRRLLIVESKRGVKRGKK